VAEELFVCGCQLLISITSAGQLIELGPTPYVVLIERAVRDEGTSYHYLAPSFYSTLADALRTRILSQWDEARLALHVGAVGPLMPRFGKRSVCWHVGVT